MPHIPRDERRRQLTAAAMQVISREGPTNATTRKIASAAHASPASVHYAFRDKQELIRAVIEYCQVLSLERLRSRLRPEEGLSSAVRAIFTEFSEWVHTEPDFHVAQFELLFWSLRNDPERTIAAQLYQGYFDLIREVLVASSDDQIEDFRLEDLARDTVAVVDGMMLQVIALGDGGPAKLDVDRYTRAVLAGFDLAAATLD